MNKPKVLAYYLPQFHVIKENSQWWGDGFTEWTALNNAKNYILTQNIRKPTTPFFQYELPNKNIMEWQAEVALSHNIDGFFIWDYWFGKGKTLLNKPKEYIRDNNLSFPYALIWANHSWYNKAIGKLLIRQEYLGIQDYKRYCLDCMTHFKKDNYIKIDNRPVFGIFMPNDIPDLNEFINIFNEIATVHGFDGIYWVAENTSVSDVFSTKFDTIVNSSTYFSKRKKIHPVEFIKEQLIRRLGLNFIGPLVYDYEKMVSCKDNFDTCESPVIFTGWDTTPRHGIRGTILKNFNEINFEKHLDHVLSHVIKSNIDLIVIKSWNEWAEGNILEPDDFFGDSLLKLFKNKFTSYFG
ncbi:glycoside hydrolase family 99-like domain-containing protein [Xenorhabdus entomophaga]|uniref:glycosyltransferase WbsX family protein n=1 Tax=Xenorhabdus entomophaga TaxID=3136257 RepID=UPI0030F43369